MFYHLAEAELEEILTGIQAPESSTYPGCSLSHLSKSFLLGASSPASLVPSFRLITGTGLSASSMAWGCVWVSAGFIPEATWLELIPGLIWRNSRYLIKFSKENKPSQLFHIWYNEGHSPADHYAHTEGLRLLIPWIAPFKSLYNQVLWQMLKERMSEGVARSNIKFLITC